MSHIEVVSRELERVLPKGIIVRTNQDLSYEFHLSYHKDGQPKDVFRVNVESTYSDQPDHSTSIKGSHTGGCGLCNQQANPSKETESYLAKINKYAKDPSFLSLIWELLGDRAGKEIREIDKTVRRPEITLVGALKDEGFKISDYSLDFSRDVVFWADLQNPRQD
ncbi:hypothetical protein ACFLZ7_01575 [Nanoarchaeota archaeon]